ncbi:MMPL family transporter [Dactylosporangium sp. AC04546]|uniref:MMPL family transporter n=1 Tax=Dactylosporangium sp. AC04546 TaxID=2862460 RepID=UPI001EDD0FB0|nr:MMPL family transporter [Dactylosporangium sp. AC04546]WVK84292.1 MMPL family transporter [Dactylosporangium sp. AC04546]
MDNRTVFTRLAARSYRHRWLALVAWVAVLAAVTVAAQTVGGDFRNDFSLPGAESQRALDTLQERAPEQAGATVQVVVERADGLAAQPVRERVEAMLGTVRGLPRVTAVRSPYADPSAMSGDGTIGYATVVFDAPSEQLPVEDVRRVIDTAGAAGGDGLRVELGGDPVRNAQESEGGPAEGAGIVAALVILVFLFGSLLAASLPIIIAVFAVGSAIGLITLASHLATIADFTVPLMLLVGLGVGIDYALLVFSRYRGELLTGADREGATRTALDTAGRTVFFAGCTVIVALLGLIALGLGSLQGVAVAIAVTVLVTMVASLTLLPALLAVVGGRVERGVRKRAQRAQRPGRADRREGDRWRAWSALVQRRPWISLVLAVGALVALTLPALGIRLGFADAGTDAPSATSRAAYDLLAKGFGAGFNGPLVVVVRGDEAAAASVERTVLSTDGVAATTPPLPAGDGLSTIIVFPDAGPQDARTAELVDRLRSQTLPPLATASGATLLVGGSTAAVVDFADAVSRRLPLFVGLVVGLSALLLLVVFRSVLIPIKAALLNLLSVGAAMGAITLVFQDGRFGAQPGPIEAYVPVMIFAIAFGLSMDYEVFLLARMHEEWQQTRDAGRAVSEGLATTGRIVTAAAAIMVLVFGSFLLDPGRMLQQFGLGLAVAVLLDAVVIRCLIVPAVMHLLGARAWWLPRRLDRLLPRVALESASEPSAGR